MFFRMIYDDRLAQAAYLIGCQRTGEAIVIDPERDVDRYINLTQQAKLRIVAVAETHIHADFLSGARELAEKTGAKVYVSDEGDADWKYRWLNKKNGGGAYNHQLLHHGDTFKIGNIVFTVSHTPGHTPEHITFTVTDTGGGANEPMGVVTGDFVFVGDLGRPDLLETAAGVVGAKEASAKSLFKSAQQFMKLPDYLQVWPAHGAGSACGKALGAVPQSTVGYEKRFNSSLRPVAAGDEQAFLGSILEGQPEPPMYFATMKRLNRDGPPILGSLPKPKELAAADIAKIDARKIAVLDTRPWTKFKAGHLPGALHCSFNNQFPTVAGSFVKENEQIVLICEHSQVEECVRMLIRVGQDQITGYATAAALESSGGKLIQTREIDAATFIHEMQDPNAFVLDVRRAAEYESGHVPGSLNIAHTRLLGHIGEVPHGKALLVHCAGGVRSAYASSLLERNGFTPTNVAGGFMAYEKAGGEVVREMAGVA